MGILYWLSKTFAAFQFAEELLYISIFDSVLAFGRYKKKSFIQLRYQIQECKVQMMFIVYKHACRLFSFIFGEKIYHQQ